MDVGAKMRNGISRSRVGSIRREGARGETPENGKGGGGV